MAHILIPRGDGKIDQDVYDAIEMTHLCQVLGCLPRAGGLFEQDSYHVWLMKHVIKADAAKAEREREKNKPH